MSKAKIVGPTGHTKYLGHFAQEKHLRAGHNTDGVMVMKRLRATAHLPRRSDTAEFDEREEATLAETHRRAAQTRIRTREFHPTTPIVDEDEGKPYIRRPKRIKS